MATRAGEILRGYSRRMLALRIGVAYGRECAIRAAAVLGFVGAGGLGHPRDPAPRVEEMGRPPSM